MQNRSTHAGGCLLAISIFGGVFLGVIFEQVSLGALIGTAVGIGIALTFWLIDRRRRG
jgi:hypothetical protein